MTNTSGRVGDHVHLHTGKTTQSPKGSTVYEIVEIPNQKFDFYTIRDAYRGGNVYNVNGRRLSPIRR